MTNKSGIEGPRLTNQGFVGQKVPDSDPDRGSQTLSEQSGTNKSGIVTNILRWSQTLTKKSGIEGLRLTNQGKKVPDSDPLIRGLTQTLSDQSDPDQSLGPSFPTFVSLGPRL